jgi:hypothetical protein
LPVPAYGYFTGGVEAGLGCGGGRRKSPLRSIVKILRIPPRSATHTSAASAKSIGSGDRRTCASVPASGERPASKEAISGAHLVPPFPRGHLALSEGRLGDTSLPSQAATHWPKVRAISAAWRGTWRDVAHRRRSATSGPASTRINAHSVAVSELEQSGARFARNGWLFRRAPLR